MIDAEMFKDETVTIEITGLNIVFKDYKTTSSLLCSQGYKAYSFYSPSLREFTYYMINK